MKTTNENSVKINESDINVVAYQKWEKAGRPAGQDMKFWLDAEAQLRAVAKASLAAPVPHPSPVTTKPAGVQPVSSQPKTPKPQQYNTRRF